MQATLTRLAQVEPGAQKYTITEGDLAYRSKCPVCGSAKATPISQVFLNRDLQFFGTSACDECLFVYRPIFPSYRWFKARWNQIASGKLEVFNETLESLRGVRYREYVELVKPFRPSGRMLDIGAGFGTGVKIFREAGYDVEALEPEDDRFHYINNALGIKCYGAALEEFVPDRRYDVITCAHNLEHVDDPKAEIERMRDYLAPGGVMYCEVPVVWNIVDWADSLFLAHKSNFAESNFAKLMREVGFECLKTHRPRLNTPHAADLGVVMCAARPNSEDGWSEMLGQDQSRTIRDIRAIYRRNAPLDLGSDDSVLRFSVPAISHFFYTVRFPDGQFVDRRHESGFIEYVPNSV